MRDAAVKRQLSIAQQVWSLQLGPSCLPQQQPRHTAQGGHNGPKNLTESQDETSIGNN